jgi:hypothetical protein
MRSIIFSWSVLVLAGCTLHIGEKSTDSAGGSESSTGGTDATGSSGETPTGSVTEPVTTGEGSTGPATGSATDVTGTTGEATSGTSGGTEGSTGTGGGVTGDATVDDSCAPDDGPALEFRLELVEPVCAAPWAVDTLRIMLYQGGPLAPGVYMLDGGNGFAWLEQGDMPPETSNVGALTIEAWDGEQVSGSYSLPEFGLAGSFAGPHCAGGGLCG